MDFRIVANTSEYLHIALSGRFDHVGIAEKGGDIKELISSQLRPTLIDISETSFMSSMGIGFLISEAKKLRVAGHKITLLKPNPIIKKAILIAKLEEVFMMEDDLDAALEALEKNRSVN